MTEIVARRGCESAHRHSGNQGDRRQPKLGGAVANAGHRATRQCDAADDSTAACCSSELCPLRRGCCGASACRDVVEFVDATRAAGIDVRPQELRDVEQVPDRDDGRRRGAAGLRQRRPAGHLPDERRQARRPDARRQAAGQVRRGILESAVSSDSGRHIRRCHGEGGPDRHAAEPLRHGRRGR